MILVRYKQKFGNPVRDMRLADLFVPQCYSDYGQLENIQAECKALREVVANLVEILYQRSLISSEEISQITDLYQVEEFEVQG